MPLLKLAKDDPKKELEFEVRCTLMMTPEERLKHWYVWNLKMLQWIKELHGHKDTPKIVKRK